MREEFEKHLAKEIDKYKGVAFPVKSSFFHRLVAKKVSCLRLHPNPDDEFSKPGVGPSFRIISEYENKLRKDKEYEVKTVADPIVVEKMYPDGYMIINGHHRWAAYYKLGFNKVPVTIVNLTHDEDIKRMLENASNDKRVTLDLDEVVFCSSDNETAENKLGFPFGALYKERIRLGIPALFHYLQGKGYDIWVYSAKFYSMDYIRNYLKKYHVDITGIVTGTSKKSDTNSETKKDIDRMIADKYRFTLHVDSNTVLKINNRTKDFEEFTIDKDNDNWSQGVMNIVGELKEDV